ncbi:formylglycine-generating enzyme family protein [Streptomyces virginiae]|uniref:formylglycine-generating enzyme family protein n=1 Tax=Streptomyces virginiae TaxID=1961 RepID=UPI0038289FB6
MVRSMEKLPDCRLPACFTQVKGGPGSLQPFATSVSCPQVFRDSYRPTADRRPLRWEWTADRFHTVGRATGPREVPPGPPTGTVRALRGGSYLCNSSYCPRYRVPARMSDTPDSSTGNIGLRCTGPAGG